MSLIEQLSGHIYDTLLWASPTWQTIDFDEISTSEQEALVTCCGAGAVQQRLTLDLWSPDHRQHTVAEVRVEGNYNHTLILRAIDPMMGDGWLAQPRMTQGVKLTTFGQQLQGEIKKNADRFAVARYVKQVYLASTQRAPIILPRVISRDATPVSVAIAQASATASIGDIHVSPIIHNHVTVEIPQQAAPVVMPGRTEPVQGSNPTGQAEAVELLHGWTDICAAVKQKGTTGEAHVKRLNSSMNGPIKTQKGGKPMVRRDKLIEWWNGLEQQYTNSQESEDKEERVSEKSAHNYGRDAKIIPDVGAVKPRRTKPQQT